MWTVGAARASATSRAPGWSCRHRWDRRWQTRCVVPQTRLARIDEADDGRDCSAVRSMAMADLWSPGMRPSLDRYARRVSVATRVIPCLDVDAGRVVKGVNFAGLRDAGDPVELARRYDAQGADELTFLDVTASSDSRETTYEVVPRTAEQVFIPLTVGGGVRTPDDVHRLLRAGADKVGVNTAAVARPELIADVADRFGAQVLVLSVDTRRCPPGTPTDGWEVTTHGGRRGPASTPSTGRRGAELGAGEILLNSMDADGTEDGFDLELLRPSAPRSACPSSPAVGPPRRSTSPRRRRRRRRGPRRQRVPLRRDGHRRRQGRDGGGGPPGPEWPPHTHPYAPLHPGPPLPSRPPPRPYTHPHPHLSTYLRLPGRTDGDC